MLTAAESGGCPGTDRSFSIHCMPGIGLDALYVLTNLIPTMTV